MWRQLLCGAALLLAACTENRQAATEAAPPWVKTAVVRADGSSLLTLSGTVRARFETPLAFQIGGRIAARRIDAGQRVEKDQVLFQLDPADLEEAVRVAEAERAYAEASLAIAQADVERFRQLLNQNFISRQTFDRTELVVREARARLDTAQARLRQARNGLGYAVLRAGAAGVVTEVTGEPGAVVTVGQTVAVLAREGEREIEVFFPESVKPPPAGSAQLADGRRYDLARRELAGAADPPSRTWRARYRIVGGTGEFPLGTVVRAGFAAGTVAAGTVAVPIGALDERGEGPRVWRVVEGRAEPLAAQVVTLTGDSAWIRAELSEGSRVIALGAHLLQPGMAVRELPP